ncbi:MAG: UDP-N-acetylmuramate dehydrogenase [Planctomycetaceae bacterium]
MSLLDEFPEITRTDEPLAPLTWLKVGGPAEFFVAPRNADELTRLVKHCCAQEIPVHLLGGGSNLLVRDEGVRGAVIHLESDAFKQIDVMGETARAGGAAVLSHLIAATVRAELAGLETLAGIPGTVGGALHGNAGTRSGDIGQFVKSVGVLTTKGERFVRKDDELAFSYRTSSIDELVVLDAEFALQKDEPANIIRRMRKLWITKKATQPLTFQTAGCIFKNPRGIRAGMLIEQCGLKGARVGGAEVSDRHANFFVTHEGAIAGDVLNLIDQTRTKVAEQFGVDLEMEIEIW